MGFDQVCICRRTSTFLSDIDGRVFLCPPPRMLKKSASGVLASLRPSTGTRPPHQLGGAHRLGAPYSSHRAPQRVRLGPSLAAALLGTRRVSARQGWAGEKSGLFEHPA